jgi:hypothetical protein
MLIELGTPTTLANVIEAMKTTEGRDDMFCLYAKNSSDQLAIDRQYFVDRYPVVQDDREIYPDFCRKNDLELVYYGQQFADVLDNVLDQRPQATLKEIVDALNYYLENDNFIDLP